MTNSKLQIPNSKESGVTLILAVVMLAAITFVSFSLSTIVIREIGGARVLLKTEPAISGALAGGEVGLYQLMRELGGTTTSGSTSPGGASYQVVSDFYDDPYLFTSTGTQVVVGLFNVENPNNRNPGYQSITIQNNGGSTPIKVNVISWSDPGNPVVADVVLSGGSILQRDLSRVDDRYLVVMEPVVAGSFAGSLSAPSLGVPSDNPGIDVTGINQDVRRKIEINLQLQEE